MVNVVRHVLRRVLRRGIPARRGAARRNEAGRYDVSSWPSYNGPKSTVPTIHANGLVVRFGARNEPCDRGPLR
jgi:hypothetical protein